MGDPEATYTKKCLKEMGTFSLKRTKCLYSVSAEDGEGGERHMKVIGNHLIELLC